MGKGYNFKSAALGSEPSFRRLSSNERIKQPNVRGLGHFAEKCEVSAFQEWRLPGRGSNPTRCIAASPLRARRRHGQTSTLAGTENLSPKPSVAIQYEKRTILPSEARFRAPVSKLRTWRTELLYVQPLRLSGKTGASRGGEPRRSLLCLAAPGFQVTADLGPWPTTTSAASDPGARAH